MLAAVLGAALNGMEDGEQPPAPISGNAYALDLPQISDSWVAAIEAFGASKEVARIFPAELIRNFVLTKKQEVRDLSERSPAEQAGIYLDTV